MELSLAEQDAAIRDIRKCKGKYWHYMDMKRWDDLKFVFTRDAIVDFRGERDLKPGQPVTMLSPVEDAIRNGDAAAHQGRDKIIRFYAELLQEWQTFHLGGEPIIELTGPDTANGMWPLFDYISHKGRSLKGYGHYHDRYRFEDGEWRIEYMALTRVRTDGEHPADFARQE